MLNSRLWILPLCSLFAASLVMAQEDAPPEEMEASVVEVEVPATEAEAPAMEVEVPATETEASVVEVEVPATETEASVVEVEVPATETEAPVVEVEVPATEAEAPAVEVEMPAMVYEVGTHYTIVDGSPSPDIPEGKTELLEFFWYGCPHCFKLEPLLNEWLEERTDTVHLTLVPAVLNARWAVGARLYYTLEEMDRLDLHTKAFYLVHEQGRPLKSSEGIARMLSPFGVDAKEFTKIYKSQAVTDRVEAEARELPKSYDISGVPALVVGGRYLIGSRNASSHQEMLDIADYLIREAP